jgi:hypothetical protein
MLSRQLNCEGKLHDSNPVPFATKNIHYSLTLSLAETENMVNARDKFPIKVGHAAGRRKAANVATRQKLGYAL